jgi:mannitol 2-dehydrogenase
VIEPNDPSWPRLTATAESAQKDPAAWLAMDDIYGDTGHHPRFQKAFGEALTAIRDKGVEAVLKEYARG